MKTIKANMKEPRWGTHSPKGYKVKLKRRRRSDPTLMIMSIMAGVGMGLVGLVFTGQF